MDVDELAELGGPDQDPGRHDGPRTALVLAVAGIVGLLAVGGVFWLVTAGLGSPDVPSSAAGPDAVSTSDPATSTTSASPTTIASTLTPTSRTPSPVLDLPPPEQPTYSLPPTTTAAPTTAPASGPTTTPAPGPTTTQAGPPQVSDARLQCRQGRGEVRGTLTFSSTAPVQASVVAGSGSTSGVRGPGLVTMSASGKGAGVCFATVNGQSIGPVPAT